MIQLKDSTETELARLKMGMLGFGGSGKTTTAALIAVALIKKCQPKHNRVVMFDSENGSDFLKPLFALHGIKFAPFKSRALADLLDVFREAQKVGDVLLIDSVTHVWTETRNAYETKKRKQGLDFRDWGPIKKEWQAFPDALVNSDLHVISCGRAGFEYEIEEQDGKKELLKTGIKMKAEGEFGYEPNLLVEMQRLPKGDEIDPKDPKTHGWNHRMIVLKDRNLTETSLNGKYFDFSGAPSWEKVYQVVKPHLDVLNIGGEHKGIDTSRTSVNLFESNEGRQERSKQVAIVLENIIAAFVEAGFNGTSDVAKKAKVRICKEVFGTASWTEIESMRLEDLQENYRLLVDTLQREIANGGGKAAKAVAVVE